MNVIIKSRDQNRAVDAILKDFGHSESPSNEQIEAAEMLARRTEEIMKGDHRHD